MSAHFDVIEHMCYHGTQQHESRRARDVLLWLASTKGEIMTDQQNYNHQLIEEFRANRHKAGGPFEGRPLLLLTTIGARSGKRRTTPMMYIPDGKRLLVMASNAGA